MQDSNQRPDSDSSWAMRALRAVRDDLALSIRRPLFWAAISIGLFVIAVYILEWPIQAVVGELIFALVLFSLGLVLLGLSLAFCVAYLIVHRRPIYLAPLPLIVNAVPLVAVYAGMRVDAKPRLDFRVNQLARQTVVDKILSGELQPDSNARSSYRQVMLPWTYQNLSRPDGGVVMVYERDGATHVVFRATRSLFAGFTGWVYRSDDQLPQLYPKALHGDRFSHIRPLAPHWFWVTYVD